MVLLEFTPTNHYVHTVLGSLHEYNGHLRYEWFKSAVLSYSVPFRTITRVSNVVYKACCVSHWDICVTNG